MCLKELGSTTWKTDIGTVARELEDCRRGYDSDLSGYRNGSSVS